jgi:two-component system chemotaxis response regulator CheB
MSPATASGHDVVVIGGSMGAFDVLKGLCAALPPDFPAAVLVVLHLSADSPNTLAGALDRLGPLPVTTAEDGMALTRGTIHVAPGDRHLLVVGETLRLGRGPRENMARPAIDPLFRSAAVSHGPRVVGLILSGYLNDGAAGLAAVRQCGGVTVVQNPADARAAAMPLSALESSDVDYRGAAADLPAMLADLVRAPPGPALPVPPGLGLEVEIALGRPCDSTVLTRIGELAPLSCPSCGGALSHMRATGPLRYRCQVGHAFTAEVLDAEQGHSADEAMRVALRVLEERIVLLEGMARDHRAGGRTRSAELVEARLGEFRHAADVIRGALLDGRI